MKLQKTLLTLLGTSLLLGSSTIGLAQNRLEKSTNSVTSRAQAGTNKVDLLRTKLDYLRNCDNDSTFNLVLSPVLDEGLLVRFQNPSATEEELWRIAPLHLRQALKMRGGDKDTYLAYADPKKVDPKKNRMPFAVIQINEEDRKLYLTPIINGRVSTNCVDLSKRSNDALCDAIRRRATYSQ